VFHYLRLHPKIEIREDWGSRLALTKTAISFLWGHGTVPNLGASASSATFRSLEQPLGALEPRVLEPLNRFLEAAAASGRYVLLFPDGWSVVDGFRNLALSYVAGMWLTRLMAADSKPTREMLVEIIVALDRGQGFDALTNARHRRRVRGLSLPGRLAGLVSWYAQ
ncbi:MAG: hypothetical protein ACYC6Y_30085, partial [Thermoguttaceae bacterium]